MKIDGIFVDRETFVKRCEENGITNDNWVDWIMDDFNEMINIFIQQAITIGTEEIEAANKKIRNNNEKSLKDG